MGGVDDKVDEAKGRMKEAAGDMMDDDQLKKEGKADRLGATAKEIGYDDFKDLDVAGKIVIMLRHTPRWNSAELPFDGPRKDEHASLDTLSKALSIPSPKESLDGSKVYPYYRAGKLAEIVEYCKRDVDSTRQVYRRLTFAKGPGPA